MMAFKSLNKYIYILLLNCPETVTVIAQNWPDLTRTDSDSFVAFVWEFSQCINTFCSLIDAEQ